MAENFYTILTNTGKAKIANAQALGTTVNLTTLKAGDGNGAYYNPVETQTALVNQVWSGAISSIDVDTENPNWIVVEAVIPTADGGFMVREVGLFDDEDDLIAVGKYPETYKPVLGEGSAKDLYVRMIIEVTNASVVTLKIDPAVVLATKKNVDDAKADAQTYADNKVANLAGEGRTTETVKANADALAAHLAEEATQDKAGHIKLSDIPKPVDYGRYQAEFGWDGATLNSTIVLNTILQLGYITPTNTDQTQTGGSSLIYGNNGVGQKLLGDFVTFDAINYVEIFGRKVGTPTVPLRISIYDATTSTTLATVDVAASSISTSETYIRFTLPTPLTVERGHILQLRLSAIGSDSSNCYNVSNAGTDVQANANFITTSNAWVTTTDTVTADLTFKINYSYKALTGTVTKTTTPADLKKWGNYKVIAANLNTDNSATVTVKSAADATLKGPITLVNGENLLDLSDLSATTYPSLKIIDAMTRNSIGDTSPELGEPSLTWEGKSSYVVWEKIADVILDNNYTQIDFILPSKYAIIKIIAKVKGDYTDGTDLDLRLNDIATAIYDSSWYSSGGSLTTTANKNTIIIGNANTIATSASDYTVGEIVIYDLPNTYKKVYATMFPDSGDSPVAIYTFGVLPQTDAITKISLLSDYSFAKIALGSTFTLLGVK